MEKKLQKINLTYKNLLIMQDLWKVHYQTLLIMFLKEFIELNVNSGTIKKICKISTTKYKDFNWFLENANFKDDLIE